MPNYTEDVKTSEKYRKNYLESIDRLLKACVLKLKTDVRNLSVE